MQAIVALTGSGRGRGRLVGCLGRVAVLTAVAWAVALGGAGIASAQAPPPATSPFAVAFSTLSVTNGVLAATANPKADTVSVFVIRQTGRLVEAHGSPFPSGGKNPQSLAFGPNGTLLAVANAGSKNVTVFEIETVLTGVGAEFKALKEVASVNTVGEPMSLAFAPTGTATADLLAVGTAGSLEMFSVNPSTGAANKLGSHPLPDGADPTSVAFSPCGDLLATANSGIDTVSVFSVDPSTGALAPVPTNGTVNLPGGSHPYSVAFGRNLSAACPGTYRLALVTYDQAGVYMFTASAAAVEPIAGSPFPGPTPGSSAVSFTSVFLGYNPFPTPVYKDWVLTANRNDTVSVFSVDPTTGGLMEVGSKTTGRGPNSLAVKLVYPGALLATANYDGGSVSVFFMDGNGALTEATGSPFGLRESPVPVSLTRIPPSPYEVGNCEPGAPVFDSDSTFFAVPASGPSDCEGVYVAVLKPGGTFDPHRNLVAAGAGPVSAASSLDGRLLAVANAGSDTVSMFFVNRATGVLTPVPGGSDGQFPVNGTPTSVAFSPRGFLAVLVNEQTVEVFRVLSNGELEHTESKTLDSTQPGEGCSLAGSSGGACVNLAFDSTGELLAVSRSAPDNDGGSGVTIVSVSPDGETLQVVGSHPAGSSSFPGASGAFSQVWVAFSPDGRLVALTNEEPVISGGQQSSVFLFSVAQAGVNKGALSPVPGSPFPTDCGARGVAFGPEEGSLGGLLGTANYDCANISLFFVGAGQGHAGATAAAHSSVLRAGQDPFLTEVPGSPVTTSPSEPFALAFSPNGQFLATSDTSDIRGFSTWGPTGRVEIDKFATPGKVAPGGVVNFTLEVHNPNAYAVTATVTDDLSDVLNKATFLHHEPPTIGTVTVDTAARRLTWHGTLKQGEEAVIRYSVRVHAGASGIITNRVLGPFGAFCSEGPRGLPCQTQTPITVPKGPGADLSVTKIPSTRSTHPGAQVLYTLVVHNHGPANATGVTVYDSAPPGVFFQSAMPTQGLPCAVTATDLTCRLGSIVNGGSAQVLVEATVATSARGDQTNLAVVRGDQRDPNPDNNTASSTITVTPWTERERVADLVVVKRAPRSVTQGHTFRYTITVTNRGPDTARNVTLTDAPRLPFRVVSIRPSRGRCQTGPPIRCALGTLNNRARVTITVTAVATTAGRQVNTASAMSTSWDPALRSNLARAETTIRPAPAPAPPPFTG